MVQKNYYRLDDNPLESNEGLQMIPAVILADRLKQTKQTNKQKQQKQNKTKQKKNKNKKKQIKNK